MVPNTLWVASSSIPKGARSVARAMSRVDGPGLVIRSSSVSIKFSSGFKCLPLPNGLVGQGGKAFADLRLIGGVHAGDHNPRAARQAVQHHPPGIHDHGMTMGFATVHVIAALGGRDHIGQVLDGARADERVPMGLSRALVYVLCAPHDSN